MVQGGRARVTPQEDNRDGSDEEQRHLKPSRTSKATTGVTGLFILNPCASGGRGGPGDTGCWELLAPKCIFRPKKLVKNVMLFFEARIS